MTTDEYSTEMELYGVSPIIIAYIMFAITLIIPLGYISRSTVFMFTFFSGPRIYSFLWEIVISSFSHRLWIVLVSLEKILQMLPLTLLPWLFAYWFVRYYQGKSSRFAVLMIGFLSILFPFMGTLVSSGLAGEIDLIYPIPLQFIIGLIILKRIEGPEIISPWSGVRLDFSWWKWRWARRKPDREQIEEDRKTSNEEEWLRDD